MVACCVFCLFSGLSFTNALLWAIVPLLNNRITAQSSGSMKENPLNHDSKCGHTCRSKDIKLSKFTYKNISKDQKFSDLHKLDVK